MNTRSFLFTDQLRRSLWAIVTSVEIAVAAEIFFGQRRIPMPDFLRSLLL